MRCEERRVIRTDKCTKGEGAECRRRNVRMTEIINHDKLPLHTRGIPVTKNRRLSGTSELFSCPKG
jgi:hypothetical protein